MEELNKLIETFLYEKRFSDGSWAEVKPEDISVLHKIIQSLLELKFQRDADGDLPIEWALVDRTREYNPFLFYCSMRYPHKLKTLGEYINLLRDAEKNMAIAQAEITKTTAYIFSLIMQDEKLKELTINVEKD
jgi:hypothetical protein